MEDSSWPSVSHTHLGIESCQVCTIVIADPGPPGSRPLLTRVWLGSVCCWQRFDLLSVSTTRPTWAGLIDRWMYAAMSEAQWISFQKMAQNTSWLLLKMLKGGDLSIKLHLSLKPEIVQRFKNWLLSRRARQDANWKPNAQAAEWSISAPVSPASVELMVLQVEWLFVNTLAKCKCRTCDSRISGQGSVHNCAENREWLILSRCTTDSYPTSRKSKLLRTFYKFNYIRLGHMCESWSKTCLSFRISLLKWYVQKYENQTW